MAKSPKKPKKAYAAGNVRYPSNANPSVSLPAYNTSLGGARRPNIAHVLVGVRFQSFSRIIYQQ